MGCSGGEFSGSGQKSPKKDAVGTPKSPNQPSQDQKVPTNPEGTNPQPTAATPSPSPSPDVQPQLSTDSGGLQIASPDYEQCASLPSAGYKSSGVCDANQVLVLINDGKSAGRTCCPIGKNVLSSVPAEMNQIRQGVCLADEVATGISTMYAPYCTKINTQYLKLQSVGVATYGTKSSPGKLGPLAAAYHISDCCACPEGSIMIGGHTSSDNRCVDQCVKVIKK